MPCVFPCDVTPDLTALYDEHAQALFAFALNMTRSEHDSRDVLQEIFARFAARPQSLANMRNPRQFLLRATHRAVIDASRRTQTRERLSERVAVESETVFASAADPDVASFRTALAAALAELPPDQRAVVHLKLWEDLTFAQIADALEIPGNTAASRYRYGLEKLRENLMPIYREIGSTNLCQP
jgi:RNA polymerase sigma-70 factor (ECF subfamily)